MTYYTPQVMIPVNATLMAVGVALVAMRLWVRLAVLPKNSRGLRIDDYLAVAGVLLTSSCTALQLWSSTKGTAGNIVTDKTSASQVITQLKVGDIQPIIEPVGLGCIKLSFIFFYRSIFWVVPEFVTASIISIWVVIAWSIAFFVAQLSICGTRLDLLWNLNQQLAGAHCGDKGALLIAFALSSILTDLLVMALPIMCIKHIQVYRSKRWGMYGVILLGAISTIACFLRLLFLCVSYHYGTLKLENAGNKALKIPAFWNAFNPSFWIVMEMWLGSWASNLIMMGPILTLGCWARPRTKKASYASTNSQASEAVHQYELYEKQRQRSEARNPATSGVDLGDEASSDRSDIRDEVKSDARSDEEHLMALPSVYGRNGESHGRSQESV